MLDIWRAAKKFELGTFDIEEKIIDQQIYAGQDLNAIYDVFMSYYKNAGRQMSVLAYITAVAHSYFRDDIKVKSDIFMIIEHRYEQELLLNDICLLALLKFYSEACPYTPEKLCHKDDIFLSAHGQACHKIRIAYFYKCTLQEVHPLFFFHSR